MFKRYISLSLALVFLFFCPETFSQSNSVCAKDDLASEFALGSFSNQNLTITSRTNGEIALKRNVPDDDFNNNDTPEGWNDSPWSAEGATYYSGGIATLNGSRIYTDKTYLPGTSIEFSARFTLGNFENIGFAKNGNFDLFWLVIGRGGIGSDPNLYVRTSDGVSVPIGSNLLNEYHNFRITWGDANFTVYVDEVIAATVKKTYTTDLIFLISDYSYDASSLSVDWIGYDRFSYMQNGEYDSRIFPISNSTASLRVNWNATLPEATDIRVSIRSGNSPVPDNTWTTFTTVSNNQTISFNNSYLQYSVSFSSYPAMFTPLLNDISFLCSDEPAPPVNTPIIISNINTVPNIDGSVNIRWITDKNSDSRIDYGTSAESLNATTSDPFFTTVHFVTIFGLAQGTTYYFRVSSRDAENNTGISPSATSAPLQFTIPVYSPQCAKDDIVSDFEGTFVKGNTEVVNMINGELALKQTSAEEHFQSSFIPQGWNGGSWVSNGKTYFSSNEFFSLVTLNGTRMYTTETFQPGTSTEFTARFTLGNFQNIGFAKNGNFDPYWLVIGRGGIATDPNLYVRSSEGVNTSLGADLLDNFHDYRIDWEAGKFLVYVDGILTATVSKTYTSPLLLMVSDNDYDGTALSVDKIKYTKKTYPNTGIYLSRIFSLSPDPASATVNWNSTMPSNTAVTISVRSSQDGSSWGSFVPVTNHQNINLGKRYLQYQAVLSTTNTKVTPLLNNISFDCGEAAPADNTPPVISGVQSDIFSNGSAVIGWSTDELTEGRLDFGTDPGNLTTSVSDELLKTSHYIFIYGLKEGTTYYYRVTSPDAANNSTVSPPVSEPPFQFTYPFTSNVCAKDATASEFDAGATGANTEIGYNVFFGNDGSIALKKTDNSVTEEFMSTTIPVGWNAGTWNSGGTTTYSGYTDGIRNPFGPTPGNGIATFNGTRIYSTQKYLPGSSISFSAKFTLGNYENIGFAQNGDFDPYWIVIGRGQLGADPNVYVRTSDGVNIPLGSNLLDEYHGYGISWNTNSFTIYSENGTVTVMKTFASPMLLQISDYNNDATALSIDWIINGLPNYPASGTFLSRVFSLGSIPESAIVSWNGSFGSNNSGNAEMLISVRSGNSATPDGSWTEFQNVSNYQLFKPKGSYLQYKAVLISKDLRTTPELFEISFTCSGTQPSNARNYIASPGQQTILSATQTFKLEQNHPNPFNNTTIISYSVPKSVRVLMMIYDLQGRVVKIVEDAHRSPGKYNVNIDTRMMGKGVYIYRIQAGEFSAIKKMIVE